MLNLSPEARGVTSLPLQEVGPRGRFDLSPDPSPERRGE